MKKFILILAIMSLYQLRNYGQEMKNYDLSIASLTPMKENSKFYFNEIDFKYYGKNNLGLGLSLRGRNLFKKETDFLCGVLFCYRTNLDLNIPAYLSVALGSGYSQQYFDNKKDKSPIFVGRAGLEFPFGKSLYVGLYTESLTIYAAQRRYELYMHTTIGIRL